jgi:hypothetical protein
MDIFLQDPGEIPLPPDEVRIRELTITPHAGRNQVEIYLEVDPFQRRPSIDLEILDSIQSTLASTSIIESDQRKMSLVMHLKSGVAGNTLRIRATLFYRQGFEEGFEGELPEAQVVQVLEKDFRFES